MSSKEDLHLPDQMMDLLFDEHRGLPVPIMNIQPDGSHDFTVVNYEWIGAHLDERLCGICGNKLGYWMAFVGGPLSTKNRAYIDPPFHEECAEAAMRVCPHMAIQNHKRAPEHRVNPDAQEPDGFVATKPDTMFIAITRDFKISHQRGAPYFSAAPPKRLREFRYVDGMLTEKV